MPVGFLTATQRERYGRYPDTLSADELARYFYLDDEDREWIATKRRDSHRLGYALQLTTVRFLGTFLEDPAAVPDAVLQVLSSQLGVADPACVRAYRESDQRWRHTREIRARYGYREFADRGVRFRLGRWLCALCWTGTDRPGALFGHAIGWLGGYKVLLPGVTVLERFVAEVRSRMELRLWRRLVRGVTPAQRQCLDDLLKPVEGSRQSWLDQLRKGPVRVSAPALVLALQRIETVRGLGIKLPGSPVPPGRIAALARFAGTVKVSAVARLPDLRRTATLAAFVHCLEAGAQDDALDVLDQLLRELFSKAEKEDRKVRQRGLRIWIGPPRPWPRPAGCCWTPTSRTTGCANASMPSLAGTHWPRRSRRSIAWCARLTMCSLTNWRPGKRRSPVFCRPCCASSGLMPTRRRRPCCRR